MKVTAQPTGDSANSHPLTCEIEAQVYDQVSFSFEAPERRITFKHKDLVRILAFLKPEDK